MELAKHNEEPRLDPFVTDRQMGIEAVPGYVVGIALAFCVIGIGKVGKVLYGTSLEGNEYGSR